MSKNTGMGEIRFRAQLQARGPAAAVVLDDAQVVAVGEGARRFPMVATINGPAGSPMPNETTPGSAGPSKRSP